MPLVGFQQLGNIARITLARPDAGNAINPALIADFSAAVDAARAVEVEPGVGQPVTEPCGMTSHGEVAPPNTFIWFRLLLAPLK